MPKDKWNFFTQENLFNLKQKATLPYILLESEGTKNFKEEADEEESVVVGDFYFTIKLRGCGNVLFLTFLVFLGRQEDTSQYEQLSLEAVFIRYAEWKAALDGLQEKTSATKTEIGHHDKTDGQSRLKKAMSQSKKNKVVKKRRHQTHFGGHVDSPWLLVLPETTNQEINQTDSLPFVSTTFSPDFSTRESWFFLSRVFQETFSSFCRESNNQIESVSSSALFYRLNGIKTFLHCSSFSHKKSLLTQEECIKKRGNTSWSLLSWRLLVKTWRNKDWFLLWQRPPRRLW